MRKNVASQVIGAQMVTAADGSAFTGTVTVYVTGDGGTQAIGSVGSGVCTHEGNGYHTYVPAQAETNYNLVAYTFIGTGAVPVTIQVFTVSFDPHDTVRLGLTALPNAAADAAGGLPISDAGGLDMDAILADTNELQTDDVPGLIAGLNDPTAAAVADAVWDEAKSGHVAVGSFGEEVQSHSLSSEITALNDISAAEVNAEVDTALADVNLDHLVGTATGIPAVPAGTFLDQGGGR